MTDIVFQSIETVERFLTHTARPTESEKAAMRVLCERVRVLDSEHAALLEFYRTETDKTYNTTKIYAAKEKCKELGI